MRDKHAIEWTTACGAPYPTIPGKYPENARQASGLRPHDGVYFPHDTSQSLQVEQGDSRYLHGEGRKTHDDETLPQHWSARLLCGLAVLLSVAVASADECGRQRLRATIDASEVLTPTSTPGVLTVTLSGTGKGRHFGRLTFAATEIIDFRQFGDPAFPNARAVVTDGEFTITAANGDTLTGTYDGVGLPDPARPGFVNGTALARLTGGTGRFRCASGFAPFTLDINAATLTEVITFDTCAKLFCHGDHD